MNSEKMKNIEKIIEEINQIIKPESLDDVFPDEKPYDDEILDLLKALPTLIIEEIITTGIEIETMFGELVERYSNKSFWDIVEISVKKRLVPFYEVKFIRDMEIEDQLKLIEKMIYYIAVYSEGTSYLIDELDITKEQTDTARRIINTICQMIIVQNYTKRFFLKKSKLVFGFEEEILEYIWAQYEENRERIFQNVLMKKIKEQEDFNDLIKEKLEI